MSFSIRSARLSTLRLRAKPPPTFNDLSNVIGDYSRAHKPPVGAGKFSTSPATGAGVRAAAPCRRYRCCSNHGSNFPLADLMLRNSCVLYLAA
jgi:hypothetical protein